MTKQQTGSTIKDKLLWLLAMGALAAALVAHYQMTWSFNQQVLLWSAVLAVASGLIMLTQQGRDGLVFVRQAHVEMRKIVWPSRQESLQTTGVVLVMVLVAGLVLWALDSTLLWSVGVITS